MKNKDLSQKLMKILHKFNRFNTREIIFLCYLVVLFIFLLFPVIKITSLSSKVTRFSIWSGEYLGTMITVLVSLAVLFLWNISVKFKNLLLTYFGGKSNDALVNFLFLFIIITSLLTISNTVRIAGFATSTITITGGCKIDIVLLLIGLVWTLISVIKSAKETSKKTQIINVVDDEHIQAEATKEEIKKGLFDNE